MKFLSFRDRALAKRVARQVPFLGISQRVMEKARIACDLAGHLEWYAFLVWDHNHLMVDDLVLVSQQNSSVSTTVLTHNLIHLMVKDVRINGWMHSHHHLPIADSFSSIDKQNSKILTNQVGFDIELGRYSFREYWGISVISLVVTSDLKHSAMLTCRISSPGVKPFYMLIPDYPTKLIEGDDFDREEFISSTSRILEESKR